MQIHEKKRDSSLCRNEFFGMLCEGGRSYSQVVGKKFHISKAVLDLKTVSSSSRLVSFMVERGGQEYLLCSLMPDTIFQTNLDLYFEKGENIRFFTKGHGTVHVTGYYVSDETDLEFAENSRKGQNSALAKKGGMKPQTSFTVSADVESSEDEESSDIEEVEKVLPKGKVVSPAKKLFSPKGTVATSPKKGIATAISKKDSSDEEDSSEEEDSDDEPDKTEDSKKLTTYATKRVHSTMESEEESSDDDDDEEEDSDGEDLKAGIANIKKQLQNNKKFKAETLTPNQNNKSGKKTPIKPAVIDLAGDAKSGKPDLNSSIGRTPMPKKSSQKLIDSFVAQMKADSKSPKKDSSDSEEEMETSAAKTPEKPTNQLDTPAQSESAKKKKKKKKNKAAATPETQDAATKSPFKAQFSKKLPSGVEYDDIRVGNGLPAKKGKLVHVYYTGKLENNKVFDSCQQGSKPFSFKLAAGQVIKGWDLGIEGMKVGGKRRLKIPAKMAYANQRMGDIPANSTLYFDVELKAVS